MRALPEKALSVGELTRALKRMIEDGFPSVWVRGEVSNLRRQASGHCYFSLKDANSQISSVLFRGNAMRIDHDLRDGQQILVFGELSVYEPRGSYQIIVRDVVEDGVGRLQREFERLKEKLRDEGLFEAERKKALPGLPTTVGVITSESGAALQDMISVFKRRGWRGNLRVFPCLVQGASAVPALVEQIERAGRMQELEVLVVARGGGSLEDLWCFNDEKVARALADSPHPTISAIGHETDFVLTDFVADLRKETPTGAAEWISSAYLDAKNRLARLSDDFLQAGDVVLKNRIRDLAQMRERTATRPFLRRIETSAQRIDETRERMVRAMNRTFRERMRSTEVLKDRLGQRRPDREWRRRRDVLQAMARRLEGLGDRWMNGKRQALEQLVRTLRTGGLDGTLKRGFVLVSDRRGHALGRASSVDAGSRVDLRFHDGTVPARIEPSAKEPETGLDDRV